jgi:transmembrane sensor
VRDTAEAVDTAASVWVARIDRGLSGEEQAALNEWLSLNVRHRGAMMRAQAVWQGLDRAEVFGIADKVRRTPASAPIRRHSIKRTAAVVAVAAAVALITAGFVLRLNSGKIDVSTALGEIRQLPLSDGSRVTLDTQSKIAVEFSSSGRIVQLDAGEALFEVVKDPKRPFLVRAGGMRVRAVGTGFLVRRQSGQEQVEIIVTKGIVDVWSEGATPGNAMRLAAGSRTSLIGARLASPVTLSVAEIVRETAWKSGLIDLDGRTLGEAIAEMNRYNARRIEVPDERLARQMLAGQVSSSDPAAFANAAATMFGVHVRSESDRLILEPSTIHQK